jgi:hypothetical protein
MPAIQLAQLLFWTISYRMSTYTLWWPPIPSLSLGLLLVALRLPAGGENERKERGGRVSHDAVVISIVLKNKSAKCIGCAKTSHLPP